MRFSAIITKEEDQFVAVCPELGVVSQGKNQEKARENLKEAIELYFEDEDARVPEKVAEPVLTFVTVDLNEIQKGIRK